MSTKDRPRLGRGLAGLLSKPVEVAPPAAQPRDERPAQDGVDGGQDKKTSSLSLDVSTTNIAPAADEAPSAGRPAGDGGDEAAGPRVRMVAAAEVVPNRFQPRRAMNEESLARLADSIRVSGVMQPILVRAMKSAAGAGPGGRGARWELVAGERRWRAAVKAGLTHLPAVVTELDDRQAAEWAVVENVQREDLNAIDRAAAIRRLIDEFALTAQEVGERLGLDRATVANTLRLLELEPEVQELVVKGELAMGHARALLAAPGGAARVEAARRAAVNAWSVRQMEVWAAEEKRKAAAKVLGVGGRGAREAGEAEQDESISPLRAELEKQLATHLGTRVRIRQRGGQKGRIELEFYSLEHFEGLMDRMGFRMES